MAVVGGMLMALVIVPLVIVLVLRCVREYLSVFTEVDCRSRPATVP